jgi:hypothetical protein
LEAFIDAIRTQGDQRTRQTAITNMLHRARATRELGHAAYRVLEQITSRCRWDFRYHFEPLNQCAWLSGLPGSQNMKRLLTQLSIHGFVQVLRLDRCAGREHELVFVTVICSAEDRSGKSWQDLKAAAREKFNGPERTKRAGYAWEVSDQDGLAGPQHESQVSSPSPHHEERVGGALLTMSGSTPHHEEHIVSPLTVEKNPSDAAPSDFSFGSVSQVWEGSAEELAAASGPQLVHGSAEARVVPQDLLDRYYRCASAWGFRDNDPRRGLTALDREQSDASCVSQLVPHADRPANIMLSAMLMTMTDVEAKRADEAAQPASAGKAFTGLATFGKFFRKALAANIRVLTDQAAQALADRTVHEARLDKRLRGVESGGAARPRSTAQSKSSIFDEFKA